MDQELTDHRPWGHYTILADEPNHKVKRIVVSPGKRFSLQRHQRRAEHWFVVSGEGRVTLDEELITLKPGEAVDIPTGTMHRMENHGEEELSFIEVQTSKIPHNKVDSLPDRIIVGHITAKPHQSRFIENLFYFRIQIQS